VSKLQEHRFDRVVLLPAVREGFRGDAHQAGPVLAGAGERGGVGGSQVLHRDLTVAQGAQVTRHMAIRCNIDWKGRVLRLASGLIFLGIGAALVVGWARPTGGWRAWSASAALAAFGLFQVFQAWAGWCIARALGFKTRI
jgi:hypothetical protein